ncbi:hypothetical protein B9G98_02419 [Wickerhamiella sorbophila]|uniref:Uncharacterized protein n=1 Tax=Wickerhamiella sorbophila TaxID=45607 RepID=A0A2T0FIN6_9ASCO|nr:hypothetical protein B9G98_02419 [Wickerhamiella sorbophila]PRT54799.1 hypothetical protein B9G98_02419 [Wickerhamiella sorbophila]
MSKQAAPWIGAEASSSLSSLPRNPMLAALKSKSPLSSSLGSRKIKSESNILNKIEDFQSSLRTGLVPEYDTVETKLSDSMDDVSERIAQLNELRKEKHELATLFFGKVDSTKIEIGAQLEKVRQWQLDEQGMNELEKGWLASLKKQKSLKQQIVRVSIGSELWHGRLFPVS